LKCNELPHIIIIIVSFLFLLINTLKIYIINQHKVQLPSLVTGLHKLVTKWGIKVPKTL